MNSYEKFLDKFDENNWFSVLDELQPEIHKVDRNAMQIWFRFYPLELRRYLESAEDKEKAQQKFVMQGDFELKNQIDSSHKFLYGHRFWREVKAEIEKRAEAFNNENTDLKSEIRQIAQAVAEKTKSDKSLTLGIAAVGLMTLDQVGLEDFKNAKGETEKPKGLLKKSPDQIVQERAKDDSQGIFGFLKTVDKKFTVTYDETKSDGKFPIINAEELATASARDQSKNWKAMDERCWEGVIPVECRSASCGTCWIGVLEGEEKLSEVARLERKQMKVFGYRQPDEAKPFLRLACQAKAHGNVSIVIPPWNGVFGKAVYGVEKVELEPVTTSAKKLRETISEVMSSTD
ncbi:MAG TPA: 2Fe-2S iron-sulfur cluster-binding protein [Pyrinomonadaceae bacterium]|nr:2Fe-2S iron-sulfur cluster-binding protein [Pyrinomonadaceae bacterium]